MSGQNRWQRIIIPVSTLLAVMVISINAYNFSGAIENKTLHAIVTHGSAVLMFLSIWMGALFANTMAYFRGATFPERLLVCLTTPIIWSAKTLYDFHGIYSTGEFFFLFFHNLVIGCPVVAILCMGLSEVWCRIIHKKRSGDTSVKVFAFGNTLALVSGIVLTTLMLWNGGHNYYYLYMDVYTYLFL